MVFDLGEWINTQLQQLGFGIHNHIYGDTFAALIIFTIAFIIGWIIYHIFERYLIKWAKKTQSAVDVEIIENVKKLVYAFVIIVGAYYGISQFTILVQYSFLIELVFAIAEILLVAYIAIRVINVLAVWYVDRLAKQRKREIDHRILVVFKRFLQAIILIIALVLILYAFHVNLSGVVIGLGVGGIAIAFALQNVLSDIFSAFTIYFDRPFEVGDFIMVGEHAGTVEKIGLKSTRVRLLQGEELVLSNREATTTSIRNFKKMTQRRVEFSIGVDPSTPSEKLKKIPDIIKTIIEHAKPAEFTMIHFKEIGQTRLIFNIVYSIKTPDYLTYLDVQQHINFAIKEAFEKEGIQLGSITTK